MFLFLFAPLSAPAPFFFSDSYFINFLFGLHACSSPVRFFFLLFFFSYKDQLEILYDQNYFTTFFEKFFFVLSSLVFVASEFVKDWRRQTMSLTIKHISQLRFML